MLSRVYLEITNVCNLSCAFCPKTARAPRFMSEAEFALAVEKIAPLTKYLYLHVMGEPLLHPSLPAFLRIAREAGMHVALTTNGIRVPETEQTLLDARLYKVSLSLHSWEANFGSEITDRAKAHFDGCFSFARSAAQNGTIVALRLWNGDRTDRKGQNTLNRWIEERLHSFFPDEWKETPRGTRLAPLCYLEQEEIFDWPDENAAETAGQIRCHGTRDHVGILSDGTVVPCCLDGEGRIALGNIFTDDLSAILQSPRVCAMREGFLRGEAVEPLCRRCGYAAARGK